MTSPTRLRIAIGPSRTLAVVLAAAHSTALAIAFIVTVPAWARLIIAAAVVTSGGISIWRSALQCSPSAIVGIEAEEGGRIACRIRDGRWHDAEVLPSSFVAPWLTVLNLRMAGGGVAHVLILPDNVEREAFRRLRVLLRWSQHSAEGSRLPGETPR